MMIRRSGVFAALLAVLFAAGCAGASTGSTSSAGSSTADPAVSVSAPASYSASSSAQPSASLGSQTISGTIVAGVEAHCLLLQDSAGSHLLVFRDPALRAQAQLGAKVTLVGTPQPRMMSTCQQGIPFIVSSLRSS